MTDSTEVRARLVEWLQGLSDVMVEVCDSHPGNPSENIFPVARCDLIEALASATEAPPVAGMGAVKPIDMLLYCPMCGIQHVDEPDDRTPDWSNPPHRSHLCHACGCIWRPADLPTNGVVRIATTGKADTWGESNSAALTKPTPPAGVSGEVVTVPKADRLVSGLQAVYGHTQAIAEYRKRVGDWSANDHDHLLISALDSIARICSHHLAGEPLAAAPEAATPSAALSFEAVKRIIADALARKGIVASDTFIANVATDNIIALAASKAPSAASKAPSAGGGVDRPFHELGANWSKAGRFELPLAMGPRVSDETKARLAALDQLSFEGLINACKFPMGSTFSFHDEPGEHDPAFVVIPGGEMVPVNGYADGDAELPTDVARAAFMVIACNGALASGETSPERGRGE